MTERFIGTSSTAYDVSIELARVQARAQSLSIVITMVGVVLALGVLGFFFDVLIHGWPA